MAIESEARTVLGDMTSRMHTATIREPLHYRASRGGTRHIPRGPCLIEWIGDGRTLVTWGDEGEHSTVLPTRDLETAIEKRQVELCE